jgi:hypothetical protein
VQIACKCKLFWIRNWWRIRLWSFLYVLWAIFLLWDKDSVFPKASWLISIPFPYLQSTALMHTAWMCGLYKQEMFPFQQSINGFSLFCHSSFNSEESSPILTNDFMPTVSLYFWGVTPLHSLFSMDLMLHSFLGQMFYWSFQGLVYQGGKIRPQQCEIGIFTVLVSYCDSIKSSL